MTHHKIFRLCIIAEFVFGLAGVLLDTFLEPTLPKEFQNYIARTAELGVTTSQWIAVIIGIPLIILLFVSWIGLFVFWRPSRFLYTLCCFVGLPLYVLLEPVVYYTSYGAIMSDLTLMAAGIILGMTYFSPLKEHFEKQNAEPGAAANSHPR